jgi:hypothetical protein
MGKMTLGELQSAVNAFAESIAKDAWVDSQLKVAARALQRATAAEGVDVIQTARCPNCSSKAEPKTIAGTVGQNRECPDCGVQWCASIS